MEFTIATCLLALSCYHMSRFSWKAGKYCCHPEVLGMDWPLSEVGTPPPHNLGMPYGLETENKQQHRTQNIILKIPWFYTPASRFSRNRHDTMGDISEQKMTNTEPFCVFGGSFLPIPCLKYWSKTISRTLRGKHITYFTAWSYYRRAYFTHC